MQSTVARGMDRNYLRGWLAKASTPGFSLKRDDSSVGLDTHLVDSRNASALCVEHDDVCSIQVCN
jgi:hypothetical protein